MKPNTYLLMCLACLLLATASVAQQTNPSTQKDKPKTDLPQMGRIFGDGPGGGGSLYIDNQFSAAQSANFWIDGIGQAYRFIATGAYYTTNGTNTGTWYTDANGSAFTFTNGFGSSEMIRFNNTGVGIGTAPAAQLHTTGTVRFEGLSNNNLLSRVLVSDASGNIAWRDVTTIGGGGGGSSQWTTNGNDIYNNNAGNVGIGTTPGAYKLDVNGTTRLNNTLFVNSGTVSIGTVSSFPAGYKLAVAGNIIAEKVRVKLQSSGWPDYVFSQNYYLPTLKETEAFIRKNSHLPGVPSASQVEKEGLDLGDGQAVLLKKIEELTLHLIEMDKKVERLVAENEILKNKAGLK